MLQILKHDKIPTTSMVKPHILVDDGVLMQLDVTYSYFDFPGVRSNKFFEMVNIKVFYWP